MEQVKLDVEVRQTRGKGPARQMRMKGKIPGVVYGLGKSESLTLDPRVLTRHLLQEGGKNKLYVLQLAGAKEIYALIKDYQVDPLSRNLKHVDMLEVDVTQKITVRVPLNFVGKPPGVKEGGVMNVVEREIEINVLPNQIPQHIDVNVGALNIGDSIHLDELEVPEGVEKTGQQNVALVAVVPPTKEVEKTETDAAAQPEVITAKADPNAEKK